MRASRSPGFTLVELMIVVAIVAILAIIAFPSYIDAVRKSRRIDAQSTLMDVAGQLERFYAANAAYTTDLTNLGHPDAGTNVTPEGYYTFRVVQPSDTCPISRCYVLEATAREGTTQTEDRFDAFRLASTSLKQERERSSGTWVTGWDGH